MNIEAIASLGTTVAALLAALVSLLTFLRQGRTDAKVASIESHTNGMQAALQKSAYDRGASDEKGGDAAPKANAP